MPLFKYMYIYIENLYPYTQNWFAFIQTSNYLFKIYFLIFNGVMVKAMDCGIVVREFVLQSRYYIHFRANTLGKGMNPLILSAMG